MQITGFVLNDYLEEKTVSPKTEFTHEEFSTERKKCLQKTNKTKKTTLDSDVEEVSSRPLPLIRVEEVKLQNKNISGSLRM